MAKIPELLRQLQTVAVHHRAAQEHFRNFHAEVTRLSRQGQSGTSLPYVPATVGDLNEAVGCFPITFSGSSNHVQFVPALASDGSGEGLVRTLSVCPITGKVGEPVERFRIDKDGLTSMTGDDGARLSIPNDVWHLAATLLLSLLPPATA